VFHSPTYRTRYAEFLKIDFPRLPLTSSLELFRPLAKLGGELVALHLMESPKLEKYITKYAGKVDSEVAKGYPKFVSGGEAALDCGREAAALGSNAQPGASVGGESSTSPDKSDSFAVAVQSASRRGRVHINPKCWFEGVPENVWNFHIGGYQVCEKCSRRRSPPNGLPGFSSRPPFRQREPPKHRTRQSRGDAAEQRQCAAGGRRQQHHSCPRECGAVLVSSPG
jgi:hypothetical protein